LFDREFLLGRVAEVLSPVYRETEKAWAIPDRRFDHDLLADEIADEGLDERGRRDRGSHGSAGDCEGALARPIVMRKEDPH